MIIAIAGNIGSGKSFLAELLSDKLGWEAYSDNSENPYIGDFYDDMSRWSFNLQIYFLGRRLRQMSQIISSGKNAIVDRTIDEDAEVFARNLHEFGILEPRDWHAYKQLYDYTAGALPQADILIYLRASSNTLVRHISRRGRDYESSIDQHYLDNLNILYEQWIASYSGRIVVVDVDEDDFVEDAPTRERVLNEICSQI